MNDKVAAITTKEHLKEKLAVFIRSSHVADKLKLEISSRDLDGNVSVSLELDLKLMS